MMLFVLFSVTVAMAQVLVRGTVVDQTGESVIGASIQVKGTTQGTITDIDGKFSLGVPDKKSVIVVSFIGYATKELQVDTSKPMSIVLEEDTKVLDEVVVVGYQEVRKKDLTGSVAKADMNELLNTPVGSFDQTLGGRIAGVNVSSSEGTPGGTMNIVIRGNNSLTQDNSPLYVIDGFPVEDAAIASTINPSDIESLDILKDASATAIYGARGANGVVIITTKKGKVGKAQLSYDGSVTMQHVTRTIPMMDAYEFVKLQAEMYPEQMTSSNGGYLMEWEGKQWTLEDYRNIDQYNWQDEIFRTALQHNHNLRLSGGTEGVRYNASLSYYNQEGILLNSGYERLQGRMNTVVRRDKLNMSLTANYSRSIQTGSTPSENSYSGMNNLFYSVWGYRPVTFPNKPLSSLMDNVMDDAVDNSNDYRFNPVKTAKNEYRKTLVDYLNANLALTWKITPDLTFKTTGGYVLNKRRREEFNGSETYTGYAGSPSGKGVNGAIYWTDQTSWSNENTLNYKKRLGRSHNLDLMAGLSLQGQKNTYDGVASTQITSEELGIAGIHTGNYQKVQSNYYDWRMMSAFLRANYNFRYKYYLTFSFRADGSSKFPSDNRWGYFPSAGLSWNFNRENLLKKSEWMSNGKLRLSWGLTGNNRTQTPYDFYSQITVNPGSGNSLDYVFGGERVPGYYVSNMANERLKWETTEQWNAGLDLGFFEDRIKVTADWYDKVTRDLLLYALLPASSGFEQGMLNIGKIRNRGFELTLETVNVKTRQFQWSTSFNIAFNRNRILGLIDGQNTLQSSVSWETRFNSQFPYISQVGKPTGMMYGFIYDGTYKAEDFDDKGNLVSGVPSFKGNAMQPGDMKYRDMNGDGVIDDYDRTIIGCGQPLNTGGFGNNFNWKNFDLNIFFAWSYGNDVLNANRLVFESGWRSQTNQLASYADRWSPENPASNIPRVNAVGREEYSSRVIEDGSFLRLKNVSLGYTLPSRSLRKAGISQMRVYVSADNIWTLTGYSGPDPEVSTRNSVLTPGFDWSAYPRAFGFTAGVNLTF